MTAAALNSIRDIIQEDIGNRGLRSDPSINLISAFPEDFSSACQSLATTSNATVAIVTGFFIPHAMRPSGETDGPLGALFLARALTPLGIKVILVTDSFCAKALEVGLAAATLRKAVPLVVLPSGEQASPMSPSDYWNGFIERSGPLTHLVSLERVGPSHTLDSLKAQGASAEDIQQYLFEIPTESRDRCHTMRGRDITASMSPAHRLFEVAREKERGIVTIGIGDGGNEIGMGKIPWAVIRRNIPNGGLVACRVPTDYLIVCGISNWGAYGLASGVRLLRGASAETDLFDLDKEEALLEMMVEKGPLVDGVSGLPTVSVDGFAFDEYAESLWRIREVLGGT